MAWRRQAFVVILVAVLSTVAASTDTTVCKDRIEARGLVQARIRCTFVEFSVAGPKRHVAVASDACARVHVNTLRATATMQARRGCTLVDVVLADVATVSSSTCACIAVYGNSPCRARVRASGAVAAWRRCALVDVHLAVVSAETGTANTAERPDAVHAR